MAGCQDEPDICVQPKSGTMSLPEMVVPASFLHPVSNTTAPNPHLTRPPTTTSSQVQAVTPTGSTPKHGLGSARAGWCHTRSEGATFLTIAERGAAQQADAQALLKCWYAAAPLLSRWWRAAHRQPAVAARAGFLHGKLLLCTPHLTVSPMAPPPQWRQSCR